MPTGSDVKTRLKSKMKVYSNRYVAVNLNTRQLEDSSTFSNRTYPLKIKNQKLPNVQMTFL